MRLMKFLFAFTLFLWASLSLPPTFAQRWSDRSRPPIIDMHIHAFGFDEYGNPAPPNEISGKRPTARNDKEVLDAVLAEMKRYNIVKFLTAEQKRDIFYNNAVRFLRLENK